jgi:anti-sigma B factor antagonist
MKIDIKDNDVQVEVSIKGDIEMMTIKELKEKLFILGQNAEKDIMMDLSGVDYIDSSGIGVLISLMRMQKKKGKLLKIDKASPNVVNVLQLSSLSDIFSL